MKLRLTCSVAAVSLAFGSLSVIAALGALPAHALGPEGCVAQGANGAVAVGTLTGTTPPGAPSSAAPGATCTFTALSSDGGWVGADSASWSVTVDTAHAARNDITGKPCGWVPNATTGTSTASGTGQAVGGDGCIMAGGSGSATVG